MIIEIDPLGRPAVRLVAATDFSRFALRSRARSGEQLDAILRAFGAGSFAGDDAWIHPDWIAATHAATAPVSAVWRDGFAAMLRSAESRAWIHSETGGIRAHITQ